MSIDGRHDKRALQFDVALCGGCLVYGLPPSLTHRNTFWAAANHKYLSAWHSGSSTPAGFLQAFCIIDINIDR